MSKHPNIAKVREYLIESGYPEDGDALLSLAAVEAELESKATIESALTKAEAVAEVPRDPVERYLFDALKQYPSKNPQRTQAAKICAGVLKLAREMADNDVENWQ